MLDEHAKIVAKRNSNKSETAFYKYLRFCHWTEEEIKEMWRYAQKYIERGRE